VEHDGTRLPTGARRPKASTGARRPEPSWPTVIATTVRLWVQRHPLLGKGATRRRRAWLALAVAVVALAAGVAGVAVGRTTSASSPAVSPAAGSAPAGQPSSGSSAALGASAAVRTVAARWVASQIAPSAVVSCDPAMCADLQADGLQATRLVVLGPAAPDPLGSDLVVATAAVRNEFGARLAGVYAPAVIASFGSGAGRIDIRAIAPDGAAAYQALLAADRSSRISSGRQLLRNPRLTLPPGARAALQAGDVDPRLLLLLAALSAELPVSVRSFGDPAPGTGATVPLRAAVLAPGAAASGAGAAAGLRAMLSLVNAQQQPYQPLHAAIAGTALTVEYAAPSPLGLLSGP
jgi:hypothetical protein